LKTSAENRRAYARFVSYHYNDLVSRDKAARLPKHPSVCTSLHVNSAAGRGFFAPNKGINMFNKLGIGDTFPNVTLNLVDGGTLDLPGGLGDGYRVILFYRGHW
jgi:hypothetical protein